MSKVDKYGGIPTIQEQRKFPKEKHPGKFRKCKKPYGVRLVPRANVPHILFTWQVTCIYRWFKSERARNESINTMVKKRDYDYTKYIFEPCYR